MIKIADISEEGVPFVFNGDEKGGHFIMQLSCPEILLVKMVGLPMERAVGLDGLYRKIFDGAVIVAATSAGDSGVELTIEI